jgi:hypothetical protein
MQATVSYWTWNERLIAHYFNREFDGRPAYLSVDEDDLEEIARNNGWASGAASLASAVRLRLGGERRLYPLVHEARQWRQSGAKGDPPFVALLGLCVLAGSQMAADFEAGIVANAYYPRLNQLLGRNAAAGQPAGFEALGAVWEGLNRWLADDLDGRHGLPTAQTRPHPRHIWWPISQCLLRAADRRRLPDFFRAVRLDPGTDISEVQLWTLLRNWAKPGCGFTDQGLRMIARATDDVAEQMACIAKRELVAWDGELRDAQGRRRGEVLLLAEKLAGGRRVTLRFVARRPEGFPDSGWLNAAGQQVDLSGAAGSHWFGSIPVAVTARTLRHGFKLTNGRLALTYEPAAAIPLRASFEPISGWLSVHQASAAEEHLVLAHSSVEAALRLFLKHHAQANWQLVRPAGDVPEGWLVALGVSITSAVLHAPEELLRLAPRLNTATRLEGGLEVVNGQYLVGGEPDLWITVAEGETCDVEIDGAVERFQTGVVPLRISTLGLEPGQHTIRAGGITRTVASFAGFPVTETAGTGCLGHRFERHSRYRPATVIAGELQRGEVPRGTVQLAGALISGRKEDLPGEQHPPMLLPSGLRFVLVGTRPGEVLQVLRPRKPEWLGTLGLGNQFFDCPMPFVVQWIISYGKFETRVKGAPGAALPPQPADSIGGEAARMWAAVIVRAAQEGAISDKEQLRWRAYVDIAKQLQNSDTAT